MVTEELKILITGSNGFIGSALGDFYRYRQNNVYGLTRANCDYSASALTSIIDDKDPDIIFHAAGSASVAYSISNPAESRQAIVGLTENLLAAVDKSKRKPKIVCFSSAAVYGEQQTHAPIMESAPLNPISLYGEYKIECEDMARHYALNAGLDILTVRIFSLFGQNQRRLLLHELFKQFEDQNAQSVKLKGTGKEARDYLSIDTFVSMTAGLVDNWPDKSAGLFNVASGQSITVIQATKIMKDLLQSSKEIECLHQNMQGNPDFWQADITKFERHCGHKISFDFRGELAKVLAQWKKTA